MSTGETPPSVTARFTSPSNTMNTNSNKKYPGTPKSPMLNTSAIGIIYFKRLSTVYIYKY